MTNNKYVRDYDFSSIVGDPNATNPICVAERQNCLLYCNLPDQDAALMCSSSCYEQESSCNRQKSIEAAIASNSASSNIFKMQMKNMVGYPVESIVKRKNINTTTYKVLGGTLNFYGEFNSNGTLLYAPQSILKMKQTQTNATADTSKLDASGAFVYDQTRYTVKTFETTPSDGYGAFGNLTKYMGRDGISNTMTHNAMNYPISKNIGITYGGNEFYSTMEYAPILGMIKTADQNNRKIRNRYDEFNRLRSVSKTLNESGTDNDFRLCWCSPRSPLFEFSQTTLAEAPRGKIYEFIRCQKKVVESKSTTFLAGVLLVKTPTKAKWIGLSAEMPQITSLNI